MAIAPLTPSKLLTVVTKLVKSSSTDFNVFRSFELALKAQARSKIYKSLRIGEGNKRFLHPI